MKQRKIKRETSFGDDVLHSLTDFLESVDRGEPITVRTFKLQLQPAEYTSDDVRRTRERLRVSQAILAQMLGVSPKTVQSWEHGDRPVPGPARRLFDDFNSNTQYWKDFFRKAIEKQWAQA